MFAFRRIWHYLFFSVWLLTLPIWIMPFVNGFIEGSFLVTLLREKYQDASGTSVIDSYRVETPRDFVPDRDVLHAPFYVPELTHRVKWWEKLGLRRFDTDEGMSGGEMFPFASFATQLESLYRKKPGDPNEEPWHHFIYLSDEEPSPGSLGKWDAGFDQLLQYHYLKPADRNATFSYLSCLENTLCSASFIRGPALLHLTTQPLSFVHQLLELTLSVENPEVAGYDVVKVRIMEFPVVYPEEFRFTPGAFPSPFNQLRSITDVAGAWEDHFEYSLPMQIMFRAFDLMEVKNKEYPWSYGLLRSVEDRLLDFFINYGIQDEDKQTQIVSRLVGISIGCVSITMTEWVISWVESFFKGLFARAYSLLSSPWTTANEADKSKPRTETEMRPGKSLVSRAWNWLWQDPIDALPDDLEDWDMETDGWYERVYERYWDEDHDDDVVTVPHKWKPGASPAPTMRQVMQVDL